MIFNVPKTVIFTFIFTTNKWIHNISNYLTKGYIYIQNIEKFGKNTSLPELKMCMNTGSPDN